MPTAVRNRKFISRGAKFSSAGEVIIGDDTNMRKEGVKPSTHSQLRRATTATQLKRNRWHQSVSRILRDKNCGNNMDENNCEKSEQFPKTNVFKQFVSSEEKSCGNDDNSLLFPTHQKNRKRYSLMSGLPKKSPRYSPEIEKVKSESYISDGPDFVSENLPRKTPLGYLCHYCGAKSANKEEWRKHMSSRHTGDGYYTCTICLKRLPSYFSMFSVEQHMLSHSSHGRRSHASQVSCPLCQETFRSTRALSQHISSQHRHPTQETISESGKTPTPISLSTIKIKQEDQDYNQNLVSGPLEASIPWQENSRSEVSYEPNEIVKPPLMQSPKSQLNTNSIKKERHNSLSQLFSCVGLKRKECDIQLDTVNYVSQLPNKRDVISEHQYLSTSTTCMNSESAESVLEEFNNNCGEEQYSEKFTSQCKPCMVYLLDYHSFFLKSTGNRKCTKCLMGFTSTSKLHKHMMSRPSWCNSGS